MKRILYLAAPLLLALLAACSGSSEQQGPAVVTAVKVSNPLPIDRVDELVTITLSKEDYGALLENLELCADLGFLVEDFGAGTVIVREAAVVFAAEEIEPAILEIAAGIRGGKTDLTVRKMDDLYHSVACRAAIKAHDLSSERELQKIAEIVRSDRTLRYCPHGRPIAMVLSRQELQKQFGRE